MESYVSHKKKKFSRIGIGEFIKAVLLPKAACTTFDGRSSGGCIDQPLTSVPVLCFPVDARQPFGKNRSADAARPIRRVPSGGMARTNLSLIHLMPRAGNANPLDSRASHPVVEPSPILCFSAGSYGSAPHHDTQAAFNSAAELPVTKRIAQEISMSAKTNTPVQLSQGSTSHTAHRDSRRAIPFSRPVRMFSGLLLLALSATAVAQTRVCIGGDVDAMNPVVIAACRSKMSGVREAIKRQGAPADWHFVVVCNEAGWKDYTSFSRQEVGLLTGASYSTDPRLGWTFLRGSDLDAEQTQTTARIVAAALNTVPGRQAMPQFAAPKNTTRQFGIARAEGAGSALLSQ